MNLMVNRDGQHLGPYSFDQACQLLAEGKLHSWDLCWPDGAREWVTLDTVPGVSDKAFALREQRRAETIAAAQTAQEGSAAAPNAQFIPNQPATPSAEPESSSKGWGWMRLVVWSSLVLAIGASIYVWIAYIKRDVLIEHLERRADALTYEQGELEPFSGAAHSYYTDGSRWEEIQFEGGLREGTRTIWHANGEVALREKYSMGKLQSATSYDDSGIESGRMENGTGKLYLYYPSGNQAQLLEFENHREIRRKIWREDGELLMVSPPEVDGTQITFTEPLPVVQPPPATNAPVQAPPPTNEPAFNVPSNNIPAIVIDTSPNPKMPARTKRWAVGDLEATSSRIDVDRRIDLLYTHASTNQIVKDFGYPDFVNPNYWTYRNMRVFNLQQGGTYNIVHFQIFQGRVARVIPTK